jgi:hypothetical protein
MVLIDRAVRMVVDRKCRRGRGLAGAAGAFLAGRQDPNTGFLDHGEDFSGPEAPVGAGLRD